MLVLDLLRGWGPAPSLPSLGNLFQSHPARLAVSWLQAPRAAPAGRLGWLGLRAQSPVLGPPHSPGGWISSGAFPTASP